MADAYGKKEITVKRISAFKFEIELSVGLSNTEGATGRAAGNDHAQNRISVIHRAPPSVSQIGYSKEEPPECNVESGDRFGSYTCERKMCNVVPAGAILIKDAILYRIIEILLWALLGEDYLALWGYPTTPTYKLLWKVVYHFSCFQSSSRTTMMALHQDHDCQGDINCFKEHVGHFLELCAPTQELKDKFRWSGLAREDILEMIYSEDLLPFLTKSDLSNYANISDSYKDILRLQEWQGQGFTAISWNGHERFSRLKSRFSWCPQCSRHLRKSVISY